MHSMQNTAKPFNDELAISENRNRHREILRSTSSTADFSNLGKDNSKTYKLNLKPIETNFCVSQ